jgi:hypothetical protein
MHPKLFVDKVIVPVMDELNMYDKSHPKFKRAVALMLGTALVESNLIYVKQIGGGPGRSFYQVETNTRKDIYNNYLKYRPHLEELVEFYRGAMPRDKAMLYNPFYSTAVARIHYWRVREALPAWDAVEMAKYHKKHYNTELGATDIEKSDDIFQKAMEMVDLYSKEW